LTGKFGILGFGPAAQVRAHLDLLDHRPDRAPVIRAFLASPFFIALAAAWDVAPGG
jgi:hypothetical protein